MTIPPFLARFVAYGFASVAALAVDLACFFGLMALGLGPPSAATGGYALGIVAHWLASSRFVFAERLASPGRRRTAQQGLFAASALVGLALTWTIVSLATMAGIDPGLAKLGAIAASFFATFLLRLRLVFSERAAAR